ncbi:MAG: ATP-binding cassette domain-containing protein [Symbiobacteriaceae bacterium]|nr:ATP-binding cassette domain-containing protein [Symbiobacteriaceae bacterium]
MEMPDNKSTAEVSHPRRQLLEVDDLAMHFSSGWGQRKIVVKAVDGISFVINEAETFGLVGESGCGKTTCGRAIVRLYDPTAGRVSFMGREISGPMNGELRSYITDNIAMVFQDPVESLNPRMTVEEIISEGLRVRGFTNKEEVRTKVLDMLDKVGLNEEHATRYPHEFSGGQRQRIGIARAIVVQPKLIIADEPVSALDVSIQAQVINLLNDLKRDMGLTIMFIAHDLSVVKYFSDRIGVMYYGKLVEIARSEDLYLNPVHPYTRSLLSAIPRPNPLSERARVRYAYDPNRDHDYSNHRPQMWELEKDHFVLLSEPEYQRYISAR